MRKKGEKGEMEGKDKGDRKSEKESERGKVYGGKR